jgi:biotin synthase
MTVETEIRHNWTYEQANALFTLPFFDLLYKAQQIHRLSFDPNAMQVATLLSIKTGACPEDCAYCPQSVHYNTELERESLLDTQDVIESAKNAKANGATRFCMGAAWKNPPREKDFCKTLEMVKAVKDLGLETCMTLGMLNSDQAERLQSAGLDFYNHNLDTSPEYYEKIITTRTYQDRLDTLEHVRKAKIKVCCGGIIGMGEEPEDRIKLLLQLANLPEHPESVPINKLIAVKGTPLGNTPEIDAFEFIRVIALTRIMMPKSVVRLSAGRESMSDEMQALCFFAGVNSIFFGEKLLTRANPAMDHDNQLLEKLGINILTGSSSPLLKAAPIP